MLKLDFKKDEKKESDDLLMLNINKSSGAGLSFRKVGDNGMLVSYEELFQILEQVAEESKHVNKRFRRNPTIGKAVKIDIKDYGAGDEAE